MAKQNNIGISESPCSPLRLPVCILPRIRCGGTVRLSHEWKQMAQIGDFKQFRHHRSTVHMVVLSDSIQHCGHRVSICRCPQCVANAIHPCVGGEGELEWSANCFHFGAELTRQCLGHQSPERRPGCNASHGPGCNASRLHLCNAVMLAIMNALKIEGGTSARAKTSAAAWNCTKLSLSSNKTRNISLEHSPCPGELPDGALRTHLPSGTNSRTSAGISFSFLGASSFAIPAWCPRCGVPMMLLSFQCHSRNRLLCETNSIRPIRACSSVDGAA